MVASGAGQVDAACIAAVVVGKQACMAVKDQTSVSHSWGGLMGGAFPQPTPSLRCSDGAIYRIGSTVGQYHDESTGLMVSSTQTIAMK